MHGQRVDNAWFLLKQGDPAPVSVVGDQPSKSRKGVEQQVFLPRIAFGILSADETDTGVVHAIETPALADGDNEGRLGRNGLFNAF